MGTATTVRVLDESGTTKRTARTVATITTTCRRLLGTMIEEVVRIITPLLGAVRRAFMGILIEVEAEVRYLAGVIHTEEEEEVTTVAVWSAECPIIRSADTR